MERIKKREQKEKKLEEVLKKINDFEFRIGEAEEYYSPAFIRSAIVTFDLYGAAIDIRRRFSNEYQRSPVWKQIWRLLRPLTRNETRRGRRARQNRIPEQLNFEGFDLVVKSVCHPSSLIWENLAIKLYEKWIRRFFVLSLCFGISFGCMVTIGWVNQFQIAFRRQMLKAQLEDGVRSSSFLLIQATIFSVSFAIITVNKIAVRNPNN